MKTVNFNTYQVYYMDNDRKKVVVAENLSYCQAVKLSQTYYSKYGISAEYQSL